MARVRSSNPLPPSVQLQPPPPRLLHDPAAKIGPTADGQTQAVIGVSPSLVLKGSISQQQQQSLEMVQIMLHVSFGTLFYLREFLPLPCFDDRDLKEAQRDKKFSYREFLDRKTPCPTLESNAQVPFGKGKRGQPLKVIIRGSDPKADMILDILENGIFDALSKNVLEAIQLTVLVDKNAPENVLESYTFSFKYSGESGDINKRLESLSIEPVGLVADIKSAQSARVGLETIVRRLITLSAFLPALPNKRNLGVHLFYTDNCPPEYEPPGFSGAKDDTIRFPHTDNWKRESQSCGLMDSGWHTVGLRVSSMKWTGPDPEGSEALPQIPSDLEHTDVVRRMDDVGFEEKESEAAINVIEQNNSTKEADPPTLDPVPSPGPSQKDDSYVEPTQDAIERLQLQKMLETQASDSLFNGDMSPTQPIVPSERPESPGSSVLTPLPPSPPPEAQKPVLSEESIRQIKEYRKAHGLDVSTEEEGLGKVKCQCGWEGEEKAKAMCSFCHSHQHLACYGYTDSDDPRLPEVHACYRCLLRLKEGPVLQEMTSLVLLRRAIQIIQTEGYPSHTSTFTEKLHCNGQTVIQMTDVLRKRELLEATPGYKSKGFIRRGLPKFFIPDSEEVRRTIQEEILDPMLKIRHHYKLPIGSQPSTESTKSLIDKEREASNEVTSRETDSSPTTKPREKRDTQPTEEILTVTGSETRSRKRKQSLPEPKEDSEQREKSTPDRLSGRVTRLSSRRESSQGTTQAPGPKTPTTTRERRRSSLRRSSRKRRKISNYSKLIDVGADEFDA
ncbi:putative meiosis specific protein Hop1 [Aspergillus saccharolyticus JOP 1030-1]|uniref:HORMA domain-containing protein n=1 Tax=Aspergillus saccharolyticus JOP 1030-1 TaxID=1450539 RepID=A0A318ZR95_9EURO|nr:hypothetical protein BP01DRAFT_293101 [Aspergillus saccharolyticus JOP 1030-1]PYH46883.1 hypothetical protein BP01DRAFT_293101 [Aspergillus saccharolyticus JOP 1030-1]